MWRFCRKAHRLYIYFSRVYPFSKINNSCYLNLSANRWCPRKTFIIWFLKCNIRYTFLNLSISEVHFFQRHIQKNNTYMYSDNNCWKELFIKRKKIIQEWQEIQKPSTSHKILFVTVRQWTNNFITAHENQ